MKECPNCRKVYSEELFFCLDDGSPLQTIREIVDSNAPTVGSFDVGSSFRTEVLPSRPVPRTVIIDAPEGSAHLGRSKIPYLVIGFLALTCLGLATILVVLNLDRFTPESSAPPTNSARNTQISTPVPSPSSTVTSQTPTPLGNKALVVAPISGTPIGRWGGTWSTESGTLFDFELRLGAIGENGLAGQITWTMRRTARPDKESKIGLSATEWVRGSFDPVERTVRLKGERKDDPDNVLVMLDEYKLKISADAKTLSGIARNGGKWNGKVNLSRRSEKD